MWNRYHAVVAKLAARAKWAAEPVGRPRKDVITRAREVIMAIFIDSFHRYDMEHAQRDGVF